jgi:hypothetical protein
MKTDVPPDSVSVELQDGGIAVEYLDGRETFYAGVPEPVARVRAPPGKEVHVLATSGDGRGVLVYVDDRRTPDEVLDGAGVGRVLLDRGDETTVFPGVRVERSGHAHVVTADTEALDGRVFVFVEDELSEARYEIVDDA